MRFIYVIGHMISNKRRHLSNTTKHRQSNNNNNNEHENSVKFVISV